MSAWVMRTAPLLLGAAVCVMPEAMAAQPLSVGLNEYYHFEAHGTVSRAAIGNPEIADILLIPGSDNEFLIVGKKSGTTSLIIWHDNGLLEDYTVSVGRGDAGQAYAIQQAIGLPRVRVQVIINGDKPRILLEGKVKDQMEHDRAVKIARLYSGDSEAKQPENGSDDGGFEYDLAYQADRTYENVIDLLQIDNPTQIRLEAQIIEVSYDNDDTYGVLFHSPTAKTMDTDTGFVTVTNGATGSFYGGEDFGGSHDTGFWLLDHFSHVNATVNLLIKNGKAKILSRPNISTMSGAKAKIHIGGSMPFPKADTNGNSTFEWKDYGIRLNISPVLEADDKITAEVHAEVSAPDYTNTITTTAGTVPSIRSRNVHSLVHIDEGYTMIIGGLLSSEDAKTVEKVPILSSIPIIGEFFKHTSKSNEKRELIILITPRVVDGDTPAEMSDKMKEWYATNEYEARNRNKVDVNDPPLPEKEKKAREKKEEERRRQAEERNESQKDTYESNRRNASQSGEQRKKPVSQVKEESADHVAAEAASTQKPATEPPASSSAHLGNSGNYARFGNINTP